MGPKPVIVQNMILYIFRLNSCHNLLRSYWHGIRVFFNLHSHTVTNAWLITNFGNFVFGCFIILVAWFSLLWISVFPVLPCSVKKVNKLLCNIFVTSLPKTTKNQVTKWDEKLISWQTKYNFRQNCPILMSFVLLRHKLKKLIYMYILFLSCFV